VRGSSLPNSSGVPVARNFSWRAFERTTASAIISGVAVVRGVFTVVVVALVAIVGDVVWADADMLAMPKAAVRSAPTRIVINGVSPFFISDLLKSSNPIFPK
jgi:hypothetical protein